MKFLCDLLKEKIVSLTLYYRGSRDGWMSEDFHSNCDNKGPTLTLLQIKEGDCIGAFTKAEWSSTEEKVDKSDECAVLFNINRKLTFPCFARSWAIRCHKINGPYFGIGELGVH